MYSEEEKSYRVSVHQSGDYRYASTQPVRINPKTKKKECRHIHWGTLTADNKFYPNKHFLEASLEERSRLIFPEDWDLSELEGPLQSEKKALQKYERILRRAGKKRREKGKEPSTPAPKREVTQGVEVEKISVDGVRKIIETLEAEGVPSDRILKVIKLVDG